MPLLAKMDSLRDDGAEQHPVLVQQSRTEEVREEKDEESGYGYFEDYDQDECMDSDMEGSVIHRGRPPKKVVKPPAVPQRSEKRASRLLENVMLELQSLDGSTQKEEDKISIVQKSDPHESYLSSEEDASLSDDYDDSLTDFEDEASLEDAEAARASSSRASSRKSQEDTARVVSFMSVGKPHIVEIYLPSPTNSNKRHSLNLEALAAFNNTTPSTSPPRSTRRPTPLKLYPAIRRMSISSITSFSSSSPSSATAHPYAASTTNLSLMTSNSPSNDALPPRKSSRLASNLTSLVTSTKNSFQSASQSAHTFLNSDPFASPTPTSTSYIPTSKNTNSTNNVPVEEQPPKTPTSLFAARNFLSRARKSSIQNMPSMPKISLAYTPGVVRPRDSEASASKLSLAIPPTTEQEPASEPAEADPNSLPRTSSAESTKVEENKVRYEDVVAGAGEIIRSPTSTSIPTPKERRAMFGRLVRTKSGKGRPAKPLLST